MLALPERRSVGMRGMFVCVAVPVVCVRPVIVSAVLARVAEKLGITGHWSKPGQWLKGPLHTRQEEQVKGRQPAVQILGEFA